MAQPGQPSHQVRFGEFELNLQTAELCNNGRKSTLQEHPCRVLVALLEVPGQLVLRETLKKKLWPADTFVDFDQGLNKAVNRLREALGDPAEDPRLIETLPRKGYRFIGRVDTVVEHPVSGVPRQISPNAERFAPRHNKLKLAAGVLSLALIVATAGWLVLRTAQQSRAPHSIRSIAVLPLENLSGDSAEDYFADGMTDELITDLGQIESLRVISRTSILQYKGVRKPLPQIARELNVDAVVEGTVMRSGNHIRITAQLIQAQTDKHLWGESFQDDVHDILRLQNDIAQAIASQIRVKLAPPQQGAALKTSRTVSLGAYESYWKGEYLLDKMTPEAVQQAADYFQDAAVKDPDYVAAYYKLAGAYQILRAIGSPPKNESQSKATRAISRALALDPLSGPAHASKGWEALLYDLDFTMAEAEFKKAVELSPNAAQGHQGLAETYAAVGQMDQAILEIDRARELDPHSLIVNFTVCRILYFARRYDEALAQCKVNLNLDPEPHRSLWYIGAIYQAKGMEADAANAFLQAWEDSGAAPNTIATLRNAQKGAGLREMWRVSLQVIRPVVRKESPLDIASVHAWAGDKNQALGWLRRAFEDRSFGIVWLGVDPRFDSLRSDPRFQKLVSKLGFTLGAPVLSSQVAYGNPSSN